MPTTPLITLRDLAAKLKVSHTTVSLALRNSPTISAARRKEVKRLAAQMGYRPDPMLSSLAFYRQRHRQAKIQSALAWINRWEPSEKLRSFHEFDLYWRGALQAAERFGYHLDEIRWAAGGSPQRIVANRGASGIDGLVATAAGFAAGSGRPVTALVGDLALLHDLNSLALLAAGKQPVVLIVINNDGGGIFSFLPVAQSGVDFERFFGAPHGLTFTGAAQQFNLPYAALTTLTALHESYLAACASGRPALLEVRTDRRLNHAEHLALQRELERALKNNA